MTNNGGERNPRKVLNGNLRLWQVLVTILGTAILTGLGAIALFGEKFGSLQSDVAHLEISQTNIASKVEMLVAENQRNFREFSDFLARLEERFNAHVREFERSRSSHSGEDR